MVRIQIDLDTKEYAIALARKGSETWRTVLLTGLDVAHDARQIGRPVASPLDDVYVNQNPVDSASDSLEGIYEALETRQQKMRGRG